MTLTLDRQAINAALSGHWDDAIHLNQEILTTDSNNLDALIRLAYALSKNGDFEHACEKYKQVIELDPYNPLAHKNLNKIKELKNKCEGKNGDSNSNNSISPSLFLSDAGKTRTVNLINTAQKSVLETLTVGEEIFPLPKRFEMHLKDNNNVYLGTLPDDIGHPLLKMLSKNVQACRFFIKDIQNNTVTVFIKFC